MNAKDRANELYKAHLELAKTDGRSFRKTVMDTLIAEFSPEPSKPMSIAAAATHYNNAKKAHEATNGAIEGLGRAPVAAGVRKPLSKKTAAVQDDNECYSVIELVKNGNDHTVGRCQAFLMQGDASETFDNKILGWPNSTWIMIQGLGPNHGDTFKLGDGEKEIKRFPVVAKEETASVPETV